MALSCTFSKGRAALSATTPAIPTSALACSEPTGGNYRGHVGHSKWPEKEYRRCPTPVPDGLLTPHKASWGRVATRGRPQWGSAHKFLRSILLRA